jgi:hypothetical protein
MLWILFPALITEVTVYEIISSSYFTSITLFTVPATVFNKVIIKDRTWRAKVFTKRDFTFLTIFLFLLLETTFKTLNAVDHFLVCLMFDTLIG